MVSIYLIKGKFLTSICHLLIYLNFSANCYLMQIIKNTELEEGEIHTAKYYDNFTCHQLSCF